MEELFKAVNLVYKLIVVTGREWGIWVGGMFNEVGGVDMEGKAFGEEVCEDCKFIGCSFIEPFTGILFFIGGFLDSGSIRFLLHINHCCDVFKH